MKVKTTFALFCLAVFLFGCAPIAQTATETPVPPTATATSTETATATATATETATPTATEAPTYNVCQPETTDPAECPLDLNKNFLSGNYAEWASGQAKPFPPNVTPIPTPLFEAYKEGIGIKYIQLYGFGVYFGGADPSLAVQKGYTVARLVLPSGQAYDLSPFYLQDPNTKETVTIIGYCPINGPTAHRPLGTIDKTIDKNIRNLIVSVAVPGIVEGYQFATTGIDDELAKIIFDADPSMPQRMKDFVNGNISALNGKPVLIELER